MKKEIFTTGIFLLLTFLSVDCYSQKIITYAGTGTLGYSGDGGAAIIANLISPSGVAVDHNGNLFITDQNNNRVRKVDAAGIITTVAGNGAIGGYSGDGGAATSAQLFFPTGAAIDDSGNIYIADQHNNVIRKVNSITGIISTVAGDNALIGYTGDGGPATNASLWHPTDVGVDGAHNIYFVDQDNSCMRKVTASTGIITTVAGNDTAGYSGDGGPGTMAKLNFPSGIAVDDSGNVYIADFYNNRIRKVTSSTGIITTVAGNGMAGYSGDGGPATAAELKNPSAIAVDSTCIYISDYVNFRIRKVNLVTGIITTIAGAGTGGFSGDCGPATAAEIYNPEGVAVDHAGNVFIADFSNARVREVTDTAICVSLETDVQSPENKCLISRNPSDGMFDIIFADGHNLKETYIYNIYGQIVYKNETTSQEQEVDIRGVAPGTYYISSMFSGLVVRSVIEIN